MTNLPTGPYRLEVALQGFRTYVQTGIVLQVGATPTINAALATRQSRGDGLRRGGGAARRRAERRHQRGRRQRADRRAAAAGAAGDRPDRARRRGGPDGTPEQPQLPGRREHLGRRRPAVRRRVPARRRDAQQPAEHGRLPLPFPDALQEFRVATSGLSAQNGMHSGASVNAVTKSGTNRFSGNVFEFLRDQRFNATSPFAPIGPDGKRQDDGLKRNQFGGTLGGPIVRDRLFFFGGYQGTRTRVSRPISSRSCRRRRCWPATSRRSPRRRATPAGRSTSVPASWATASIRRSSARPR